MNPTTPWLAAMLLLCPLGAQDPAAPPVDAAVRLKQFEAEQEQIVAAWRQTQREIAEAAKNAKPGKAVRAMSMRPDLGSLSKKYLAAAKDYPGEEAVQFLLPALQMSTTAEQRKAVLDQLLDDHLDSPQLGEIGGMLPHLDRMISEDYAKAAIAKIEKHGKNLPLLGWIAFNEHKKTLESKSATSKAFLDAKMVVAAALEKAGDKRLQGQFDSLIAEQEKFGIGMVAPDIIGTDLDGVDFKLSDYKGKVVFLDFWGDW